MNILKFLLTATHSFSKIHLVLTPYGVMCCHHRILRSASAHHGRTFFLLHSPLRRLQQAVATRMCSQVMLQGFTDSKESGERRWLQKPFLSLTHTASCSHSQGQRQSLTLYVHVYKSSILKMKRNNATMMSHLLLSLITSLEVSFKRVRLKIVSC